MGFEILTHSTSVMLFVILFFIISFNACYCIPDTSLADTPTRGVPQDLKPVLVLPGLFGSRMESYSQNEKNHNKLNHDKIWNKIWVNVRNFLIPFEFSKISNELQINYDIRTDSFSNNTDTQIKVIEDFSGCEYMDIVTEDIKLLSYFSGLVKTLEYVGYEKGLNVMAVTYDWRLPTFALNSSFSEIKEKIELLYAQNDNAKVVVLCHSLGNVLFTSFLQRMPQSWKDKFIDIMFSVAGPFMGSPMIPEAILSGMKWGSDFIHHDIVKASDARDLARGLPSLVQLWPTFMDNTTLVSYQGQNFTGSPSDFLKLAKIWGLSDEIITVYERYNLFQQKSFLPTSIGVSLYILCGTDTKQDLTFSYESIDPIEPEIIATVNGDGTVPLESCRAPLAWKSYEKYSIQYKELSKISHFDLIKDPEAIDVFLTDVLHIKNDILIQGALRQAVLHDEGILS